MRVVQASRASAILYSLLMSRQDKRPWLLPANICPIVPITFLKSGVPFEFVDISDETLHMDLDQAAALVMTRQFGGLLYAHTYGDASSPNDFFHELKKTDESLLVVDDRCLCAPDVQPDPASFADVQLYSTGYAKVVDLDSGGYAFLVDRVSYSLFHSLFNPDALNQTEEGYKYAVQHKSVFEYQDTNWLQTDGDVKPWTEYCLLVSGELTRSITHRKKLNAIYQRLLPRDIQMSDNYQLWRFNIVVENKSDILKAIFENGLFASSHYPSLAGIMADGSCPRAESLHSRVINLFNDHHFDEQKAERVCNVILSCI